MKKSCVLWFTGLSGSGKTTLAKGLKKILQKNYAVQIVDGDEFRNRVHPELKFTPEEIIANNKKIIDFCKKKSAEKDFLLVPVIAPFESTRQMARRKLKNYIEIFCSASLQTCIERDPKGLYKKALEGKINNFIGIDKNVPYQKPKQPEITIETGKYSAEKCVEQIVEYLINKDLI